MPVQIAAGDHPLKMLANFQDFWPTLSKFGKLVVSCIWNKEEYWFKKELVTPKIFLKSRLFWLVAHLWRRNLMLMYCDLWKKKSKIKWRPVECSRHVYLTVHLSVHLCVHFLFILFFFCLYFCCMVAFMFVYAFGCTFIVLLAVCLSVNSFCRVSVGFLQICL